MVGSSPHRLHRSAWRYRGRVPLHRTVLALAILLSASFASAQAQAMTPPPAQQRPTLYQQLGGYDGVHEFVALVFPRVAQHPRLRHMFQGHGADSQQRQFQLVVEMVCQRTGGPCAYIGRDMNAVHVGLGITAANWETFMAIIDRGLDEKKYSPPVRAAFREMWASFREGVVEP